MSIKADVDRGLEIRTQMAALETELKGIEARLKDAGLNGPQVDLKDEDREGKQYLAAGSQMVVPVIFTADKLMGEFAANGDKHVRVKEAAGSFFLQFFKPVNGYKNRFEDGKKFRNQASDLMGDKAPAFITACIARDKDGIPKSDIKILWDDAAAKEN